MKNEVTKKPSVIYNVNLSESAKVIGQEMSASGKYFILYGDVWINYENKKLTAIRAITEFEHYVKFLYRYSNGSIREKSINRHIARNILSSYAFLSQFKSKEKDVVECSL